MEEVENPKVAQLVNSIAIPKPENSAAAALLRR